LCARKESGDVAINDLGLSSTYQNGRQKNETHTHVKGRRSMEEKEDANRKANLLATYVEDVPPVWCALFCSLPHVSSTLIRI
jgi:hypothetical protein